jgi:DNA-binding transcriptional ArsR family regulator
MYAVDVRDNPVDVWQALADPSRRTLIDRLAGGPKTTSQLCAGMPMSRFGVMKHLGVLERAGIVIARRHGRLRMNHLNTAPLRLLQSGWLSPHAQRVADSIGAFAATLSEDNMQTGNSKDATGVVDVALEWVVRASVQRTWEALFQHPERWWPAAHRAGGEGAVMTFEPRIGAQLREERPDGGGLIWYTIIALDPLRSVDMVGHLAARYGGPAESLLNLELVPGNADGTTLLKLTDSVFGRIGPDMRTSLESGWQAIVGMGLVELLQD